MPGISDSGNPDDIRIHLDEMVDANRKTGVAPEGETPAQKELRESVQLKPPLASRLEAILALVVEAVPGLSDAEVKKLLATRAARDALARGRAVLARVDNHLQSVTGERNPTLGRSYGVYGRNPTTFGGVFRALSQCVTENDRVKALPAEGEGRLAFSPRVTRLVTESRDELRTVLGERLASRSELSQAVVVKSEVIAEAKAVISAVRNHLYAELPLRKRDPQLRDYGFRPIRTGTRSVEEEDVDVVEEEAEEEVAAE